MHRRDFPRCLTGLFLAEGPFAAAAQTTTKLRRIGYLGPGAPDALEDMSAALKELGWIEGGGGPVTVEVGRQSFAELGLTGRLSTMVPCG
jgi:hypothetical protein